VSAAGTSNLTLLSKRVAPARRPLVAALVWIMMIAGFSLSAGFVGHFLRPFSALRLVQVFTVACVLAFTLAWLAVGRERKLPGAVPTQRLAHTPLAGGLAEALRQQWANAEVRCFTVFIFVSMMAFSAQELLLEPFAGLVFGLPPAASARLASLQNGGVLTGMIALVVASLLRRGAAHPRFAIRWMIAGTTGSALAIAMLAYLCAQPSVPLLHATAVALGVANGVFAVAALGTMMELSGRGGRGQEGMRMGLWGSAQAVAFAVGGLSAGVAVDLARHWTGTASAAYTGVFCLDAALFLLASLWAFRLGGSTSARRFLQVGAEATVDL
jgi:BCD family chlorophyll transporter-like MFS transporter